MPTPPNVLPFPSKPRWGVSASLTPARLELQRAINQKLRDLIDNPQRQDNSPLQAPAK